MDILKLLNCSLIRRLLDYLTFKMIFILQFQAANLVMRNLHFVQWKQDMLLLSLSSKARTSFLIQSLVSRLNRNTLFVLSWYHFEFVAFSCTLQFQCYSACLMSMIAIMILKICGPLAICSIYVRA